MAASVVLVVDDNELIRETLSDILTDAGYDVATAENGQKALEVMHRLSIRLVFLDLLMPVMDGWQVFSEMRASPSLTGIPVCAMTVTAREGPAGTACTLHLPYDLKTVLQIARTHALP